MAQGENDRQLAHTLVCSPGMVSYWSGKIYVKLGARNRTHAVHLGHVHGLLS